MESLNFLQPSINNIRKSIRGIDDSYNNFWDILAELLQNSVDAINAKEEKKGSIYIEIDSIKKSILVRDDGIGIKRDEIPRLLRLFSTNKEDDSSSIGEKGVGLKFVIFQSTKFQLITKTSDENQTSYVVIDNAKIWKMAKDENDLLLNIGNIDKDIQGTEIFVEGIENDSLFNVDFNKIKYIIRTRTAVGNVLSLFEKVTDIKVYLKHTDLNGTIKEEEIPYSYWLPTECLKKADIIDFDDYNLWLSERDRSDSEKRIKLKNKIIVRKGEIAHTDVRKIKYWACFVPQRKIWNDISIKDELLSEDLLDNEQGLQDNATYMHQPGIFTSVKGMPTGISILHPTTGNAGYWPNFFIILEDRLLKFDIGRKNISRSITSIYQDHLKNIFNNITSIVTKYISGNPDTTVNPIWNRDDIKTEIDNLTPLNNSLVQFSKLPSDQEASVAAIFYELIGSGKIKNIVPAISGYRNKYDLYAYYKSHFLVIEFKSHLKNLLRDFDDYTKMSNEIDYIICWDVNDTDKTEFHNHSLALEEVEHSDFFTSNEEFIEETTHKIIISSSSKPIYVIDLKKLLSNLSNE